MQTLAEKIRKAAELIQAANHVVVLTGAGVSTPSGIPDFRSPNSGLWEQTNPMEVASIMAFRQNPADFYAWVRPLAKLGLQAQPNAAHEALAQLESGGKLKTIITQNVDGLHQAAGSQTVLEVHGHAREMTCMRCYKIVDAGPIFEKFLQDGDVPHCDCGGVFKPNVTLFGEQLPVQTLLDAKAAARKADLIIVAGSSLEVAPVSELPAEALRHQAKIIVLNKQPTYINEQAELVIQDDLTHILPQIVNLVLQVA